MVKWVAHAVVAGILLLCAQASHAAPAVFRVGLESGINVQIRDGQDIYLECRIPPGDGAKRTVQRLLANPDKWPPLAGRTVAFPLSDLNPAMQRAALLCLFPEDAVDARGWIHVVRFADAARDGQENTGAIAAWLTGDSGNHTKIRAANGLGDVALRKGQKLLIPSSLLLDVFRTPTTRAANLPPPSARTSPASRTGQGVPVAVASSATPDTPDQPFDADAAAAELSYGSDKKGEYAVYRLKPNEAIYSSVVVRFTDIRGDKFVKEAAKVVQKRSDIKDVCSIKPGTRILIPVDMLSDGFKPNTSQERREYDAVVQQARQLKGQVRSRELDGVVVILDPGHGGRDLGTSNPKFGLYEDEINYDIVCRVKDILERETKAKVVVTMLDHDQGYRGVERIGFLNNSDEEVLTTPPYKNMDAKVSANLRWYLANSKYRQEVSKGTDPRKMIFTSFHTDYLYNDSIRGAMIYIPGAKARAAKSSEEHNGHPYNLYREVKEQPKVEVSSSDRARDEALSRNFAETLYDCLGKRDIRRHKEGPAIRAQIRQDGGVVYVPAVLRNTLVPTKVLIETANINNDTDCERLADSQWRQQFAQAYVDALKAHFGS